MHDAGAAVVAAQLLAFYKEPIRYRPRLTHGHAPFPGGLAVFRFAQGRFPHGLMRDMSAGERERLREAAVFFIRQVCLWDNATHYQLLCVPPGARREAIKEHYHGLMALIHPDRQDAQSEHWPEGCAQRVNQAYAVLCDEAQRRRYDAGLVKAAAGAASLDDAVMATPWGVPPTHAPPRDRSASGRIRMRKPVLLVSAVIATLFFMQVWWVSDVPREYSMLPNAAPLELSLKWMRETYSSSGPRFMGAGEAARRADSDARAGDAPPTSFLDPLWRALAKPAAIQAAAPRPAIEPPAAAVAIPAPLPERPPAQPTPGALRDAPRSAQAPAVAQDKPAAKPAVAFDSALGSEEMENLVALVVGYYEAGDLDRLLALFDPPSVGLWEAVRVRHEFQEFFRTTHSRRLRLQRVSWDAIGQRALVRGSATLVAQFTDAPGVLERKVELDLEVVARDGQPRISRLYLYPHTR